MSNSVVIKSNSYGISVYLNDELEYADLLKEVIEKFKDSSKFFKNAKMVVAFEGKELTNEQIFEMLDAITTYSGLNITCVVDKNIDMEQYYKEQLIRSLSESASRNAKFYKGNVTSGQILESDESIIILGSVEEDAKVYAKGNVIILGGLYGKIYAGTEGNEKSFVFALTMDPLLIKIGNVIAKKPEKTPIKLKFGKKNSNESKIAYVEDNNIYIENVTNELFTNSMINE